MPNIKVFNKGVKPVVWKRGLKGTEAIHPRKFDLFSEKLGKEIIKKFDDACSEEEYNKHVEDINAKATRSNMEWLANKYKVKFSEKTTNEDLQISIDKAIVKSKESEK